MATTAKSSSKTKRRSRRGGGNKPKDELERFIPKVWYWAVYDRCKWSDSDLNIEFVPDKDGNRRDRTSRTRTFEGIRKRGVSPSSAEKKHRLRNFDLVKVVDAHPMFRGTARVMYSPFWRLLKEMPGNLEASRRLVDECLSLLSLERLSAWDSLLVLAECIRTDPVEMRSGLKEGDVSAFEVIMQRAMANLPVDLDRLCLLGAMYREACLSFLPSEAEVLGQYFAISLAIFCDQDWIAEVHDWLEDIARQRVLFGQQDYFPPKGRVHDDRWSRPTLVIQRRAISVSNGGSK